MYSHSRLSRCTSITTGEDGPIPRCKPFKYTYEKEIVIYPCHFIMVVHIMFIIYTLIGVYFSRESALPLTYYCLYGLSFKFYKPLTCSSRMHTLKSWTTSLLNVSTECSTSYFPVPYFLCL